MPEVGRADEFTAETPPYGIECLLLGIGEESGKEVEFPQEESSLRGRESWALYAHQRSVEV